MGTTTSLTFAEFAALPSGPERLELLKEELIRMPPAQRRHTESAEKLYELLKAAIEDARRSEPHARSGRVHHKMGYLLNSAPESWLQPDVSITHPDQPGDRYYEGAPCLVFEIVSEYDMASDIEEKAQEYLSCGAVEVFFIYPKTRHARRFLAGDKRAERQDGVLTSSQLPFIQIAFAAFL